MKLKYPLQHPYALPVADVLQSLQTDPDTGLDDDEAARRSHEFGLNSYKAQGKKSIGLMFVKQFESPIVYLLIAGAIVSAFFNDPLEAASIAGVVLINAVIGFFMELQAQSSMSALLKMDIIQSTVIRNKRIINIPSEQLVPGDLLSFEAGDVIPADARLINVNQLQCDESSLTGESQPSVKTLAVLSKDSALGDQQNMVFKGTSVMTGKGKAIVTGIADQTQLGGITALVDRVKEVSTPLDRKLNGLTRKLIIVTLIMTLLFAIISISEGKNWILIVETSIALAVAAIPEGLPIVATVALSYGMLLMAKRNAIVKKLSSVETLGSTSVILTDKTGTLTENKILADTFAFSDEEVKIAFDKNPPKDPTGLPEQTDENINKLIVIGALCNNAYSEKHSQGVLHLGDAIEIALLKLVTASGLEIEDLNKEYPRIAETPFNSEIMMMGTLHKISNGYFSSAKGSAEHLLKKCSRIQVGQSIEELSIEKREGILSQSYQMAARGLRVLAFAYREDLVLNHQNYLSDLIYVGLIGFLDPPRLDSREAIQSCKTAGIKVVMITGDHPATALNIARTVGLIETSETNVILGKELPLHMNQLTQEWKDKILNTRVFARTNPKQKLEIAMIHQEAGNIVAMTGDGVNDAPALKQADVGIAMGLRGTQVAKETADIVLKDDSFISISEAVSHGREIFQNIQKFVVYLISCNLSEIFIVTILGMIAPASTLLPLQILFLNMVTDVFPALALGLGKGDKTIMQKPPRDPLKDIISRKAWIIISLYSLLITLAVLSAVYYCKMFISQDASIINNVAFITLIFTQLFHVFNMASKGSNLVFNEITKNIFIWVALLLCAGFTVLAFLFAPTRYILNLDVLSSRAWVACILAGMIPMIIVHVYKIMMHYSQLLPRKKD